MTERTVFCSVRQRRQACLLPLSAAYPLLLRAPSAASPPGRPITVPLVTDCCRAIMRIVTTSVHDRKSHWRLLSHRLFLCRQIDLFCTRIDFEIYAELQRVNARMQAQR